MPVPTPTPKGSRFAQYKQKKARQPTRTNTVIPNESGNSGTATKNKNSTTSEFPKAATVWPTISESNIESLENDTLLKVNTAISALENAISRWDAAKQKPHRLEAAFTKYKDFHGALARWETRMLKQPGARLDFSSRVERLKEFVEICHRYQSTDVQ